MYNDFIRRIVANMEQYLNYESVVRDSKFNIVDKDGKDITSDIENAVAGSGKPSSKLLDLILNNSIATIHYLTTNPERNSDVLNLKPDFADAYLSDINFSLYYIDKILGNDISKNPDFITKLKNLLTTKNTNLIPIYMFVTGDIDQNLVDAFVLKYYLADPNTAKENMGLIRDFVIALQQHNKVAEQYKNPNVKNMLDLFSSSEQHTLNSDQKDNKESGNVNNVFGLDFKAIDNQEFINFFNQLNNIGQHILTNEDINSEDVNPTQFVDDYLGRVADLESLKTLLSDGELVKSYAQIARSSESGKKFYEFLKGLLNKVTKSANIRGKNMFKLAKAYTRYYIKNILPSVVRYAGNDPEATSQVIKVSTDEIQDLMYGDTVKHPENLAEVNNPAVRDQIALDVEHAVKGDQLTDGAADGMSIEDIAKKWSEIYKQVPYEHLLEVLKTQEQAGSIVEQEHTDNLEIAKEIARDHLVESPDYYTHLENMEKVFPADNVAEKPLPEPEGMDLKTLENPLPKNEGPDHICDGSCGGNCKCHHDKVQTVEDKVKGLNDDMFVIVVSETPDVVEEQPLDFIQQIAAKIKR